MVVKVNRVVPRQAPDAQRAQQERQQYEQWLTTAEGLAYYELLKQRFKVQIKAPRPDAAAQVTAEN
jgi:peptidyl-prolyl cis-trans isomerase D